MVTSRSAFAITLRSLRLMVKSRAGTRTLRQALQKELADEAGERSSGSPPEQLPLVIFALGIGLSLQAYLDPAALPADLYERALEHLLR